MSDKTLTAMHIAENDKKRNTAIFEQQVEDFFRRFAPEDRSERVQFELSLFSLVRQIYADAQEPLLKQLTATIGAMATVQTPVIFPPDPRFHGSTK
jgi:hypothetical protein